LIESFGQWITHDAAGFFTLLLVVVGVFQLGLFYYQLRLIRESLEDARVAADAATKSANAATLNAQAVINAERAHLFVSIEGENIASLISNAAAAPVPAVMEDGQIHGLNLSYALKNYGKTPAVIKDIKHGTLVAPDLLWGQEYESVVDLPAHILGGGEKTLISIIDLPRLTARDARSIRGAENTFWFYGTVIYDDTFGWRRTLKFLWHYGADSDGFRIFEYQETEERRQDED
jgi:hypothetical protein